MNENKVIVDTLKPFLPMVKDWIVNYVDQYSSQSKPVSELCFSRLSNYYSSEVLNSAKVVFVDEVKMIPLTELGIPGFESLDAAGVTYLDTFFVNKSYANSESIFFHELVHIVQWRHIGIDVFLLLYGLELKKFGYRGSLFEKQAYSLQERFERAPDPFNVEQLIIPQIDSVLNDFI